MKNFFQEQQSQNIKIICDHCHTELTQNCSFCFHCGAPTEHAKVYCRTCGTEIQSHFQFCFNCGTPFKRSHSFTKTLRKNTIILLIKQIRKKLTLKYLLGMIAGIMVFVMITTILVGYNKHSQTEGPYNKGCQFLENEEYDSAITNFIFLEKRGGYNDSQEKFYLTLQLWIADQLESGTPETIDQMFSLLEYKAWSPYSEYDSACEPLTDSVAINIIYNSTIAYIGRHPESTFWFDNNYANCATDAVLKIKQMLSIIPEDHKDTKAILDFLDLLSLPGGDFCRFDLGLEDSAVIIANTFEVEKMKPILRGLLSADWYITSYLLGSWSDDWHSMLFYKNDNTTYCKYNLPHAATPEGAEHWKIRDCVFSWYDAYDSCLSNVYKFTISDYYTINVYCYISEKSYTLHRK